MFTEYVYSQLAGHTNSFWLLKIAISLYLLNVSFPLCFVISAFKQKNVSKKPLTAPTPAWPPASGKQNGIPGIGSIGVPPQIPGFRAPALGMPSNIERPGYAQLSQPTASGPSPSQPGPLGPSPARPGPLGPSPARPGPLGPSPARPGPENRGSVLRPDAPTFEPNQHHNSRGKMRAQFDPPRPQRFGGPGMFTLYCVRYDIIQYKPVSQSCTVVKSKKFWQATGQSNLADKHLAATKASNLVFVLTQLYFDQWSSIPSLPV